MTAIRRETDKKRLTKFEIKAPHEEPAIYEFDVQNVDLGEDILFKDYIHHLHEAYDDYLDEDIGIIDLLGAEYRASEVLKAVDEIAYSCHFNDWIDSEMEYAYEGIDTYGYTFMGEIEITLISDLEEEEE